MDKLLFLRQQCHQLLDMNVTNIVEAASQQLCHFLTREFRGPTSLCPSLHLDGRHVTIAEREMNGLFFSCVSPCMSAVTIKSCKYDFILHCASNSVLTQVTPTIPNTDENLTSTFERAKSQTVNKLCN